jgi:hypothetical protein
VLVDSTEDSSDDGKQNQQLPITTISWREAGDDSDSEDKMPDFEGQDECQ